MDNGKSKFSFGFSKSKKNTLLSKTPAISSESVSINTQRDYLTSFENLTAQSVTPEIVEDFVIPLKASRSNVHARLAKRYLKADPEDQLTVDAINELTSEGQLTYESTHPLESSLVVSVPENMPTTEADDADYDVVPIEKYGLALLKGMGFKTETRGPSLEDYAEKIRLKGLGLGADPTVLLASRQKGKTSLSNSNEKLSWVKGAKCQIIFGRRDGQYGVIEGVDGDTGRVVVRMAATKQVHSIMQSTLRLVTNAEYEKFSSYLNRAAAAKYKQDGAVNGNAQISNDIHVKRMRMPDSPPNPESRLNGRLDPENRASLSRTDPHDADEGKTWIREGLIVNYINNHGCYGKYYGQRVAVLSISYTPSFSCSCETKSGRILKDVRLDDIRTVVPHNPGSRIMIVGGDHEGETGELLKRNSKTATARVLLRHSRIEITTSFENICLFAA